MQERTDAEKEDEVMLPGFRFHPTDEELVGFYLRRKIQQKPVTIELIRQLDIYKYDPWDLPKLATTGEKEWYFYCPRDRKYRNSVRPNRVTGAGFWKATGTDRPIYSSEGTKCIGLKKSLVFYRGRAAKGIKTDWMMHEFRLPSLTDSSLIKRPLEKNIPANDSWAICRIFQKTNSMAQRVLSHSWIPPLPESTDSDMFTLSQAAHCHRYCSENIPCTSTETGSAIQFGSNNGLAQQPITLSYLPFDVNSYKPLNLMNSRPSYLPTSSTEMPTNFMFSQAEISVPPRGMFDIASMLLNLSPGDIEKATATTIDFGQPHHETVSAIDLPLDISGHSGCGEEVLSAKKIANTCNATNNQWGTLPSVNFPFNPSPNLSDEWKPSLPWDSQPSPSEMSASYSTNKSST